MDLKSNFGREWTAGVLFRMHRGVQPTIRLLSLIVGNRQVTVCRAGVSSLPWHLCPPRLHLGVEPQGIVRWRHAPLLGPLRQCRSKRKSLSPAASRRPPVGRRGHRRNVFHAGIYTFIRRSGISEGVGPTAAFPFLGSCLISPRCPVPRLQGQHAKCSPSPAACVWVPVSLSIKQRGQAR
jgi:hypothetical protein